MEKKCSCGKKAVVGIVLVLSLIVGGSLLYAHVGAPWGSGFGSHEEQVAMVASYLTKKLDLDATQQQELDSITQKLLADGKAFHEMRNNDRQEVVGILRADTMDMQHIQLLQGRHKEMLNDFVSELGDRLVEFVKILTPEQRQRLATLIENHAGHCPMQ